MGGNRILWLTGNNAKYLGYESMDLSIQGLGKRKVGSKISLK